MTTRDRYSKSRYPHWANKCRGHTSTYEH